MKKIFLLISAVCILTEMYGQQFSFQMFFIDSIGNKDTITLGYDLTATDSIDSVFGEINIIADPLSTALDVRITNEWYNRNYFFTPGTYHTKKQIVNAHCSFTTIQTIDIHTNHWPVTVTWDSSAFHDSCRNGSVFTSINPGGWWDTGSPSDLWRQEFLLHDSVTFTSNAPGGLPIYGYVNDNGDTIPVFWQVFGDSSLLFSSINQINSDKQQLIVFPNPTDRNVNLKIPYEFGKIESIEVFSSIGQLVQIPNSELNFDLSEFEKGLYFIVVTNNYGEKLTTRILKE